MLSPRRIAQRVKEVEASRSRDTPILEVHEAWTVPPIGASGDFLKTHAAGEELRVWCVALRLHGLLRLRRLTVAVKGTANTRFGLAIYKATFPLRGQKATMLSSSLPLELSLVASAPTKPYASADLDSLNFNLEKDVVLDPRKAVYFVGYSSSHADCEWFTPNNSGELLAGFKTTPAGTALAPFPSRIVRVAGSLESAIAVAAWSAIGVQLYQPQSEIA